MQSLHVDANEWAGLIRREYLNDYIGQGGAALKFAVVGSDDLAGRVLTRVSSDASGLDYLVARVDAATVGVHRMDQVFHATARQIAWADLARRVLKQSYTDIGVEVTGTDLSVDTLAAQNGVTPGPLRAELRRALEALLNRSYDLARDFRYAMRWLCFSLSYRDGMGGHQEKLILDWLAGELRLISALKELQIFRKIDRYNARAMFSSLGSWARLAGLRGVVLLLDIRQLSVARRADAAGKQHYSAQAVMDAYEVLRQFIDATDDLVGLLTVVVANPDLFDDEKRGVKTYKALYERVWPDVRVREYANPLSSLGYLKEERL